MAPERPSDDKPSPAEVRQRISSLYDQVENATGKFNATRAMRDKRRTRGGSGSWSGSRESDPALNQLTKQWFNVARAQLGPIVPAALPPDRMPGRDGSRTGAPSGRPADASKGRSLEGGSSRLELTAGQAQTGAAPALPAGAAGAPAAPAGELPTAAPAAAPAAPIGELTSRSMQPQSTDATDALPTGATDPQSTGAFEALTSRSMQPPPAGAADALTAGTADPQSTGAMEALTSRSMQPQPTGTMDVLPTNSPEPSTGIIEALPPQTTGPQPTGTMDALSTGAMNALTTNGTTDPQSTGTFDALTSRPMQPPPAGAMDPLATNATGPRSTGTFEGLTSRSMQPQPTGAVDALSTGPVEPLAAGPAGSAVGSVGTPPPVAGAQPQVPGTPHTSVAGRRQPEQRSAKGQWQAKLAQAQGLLSQHSSQQGAAQWQQHSTGMFDTTPPLDGNSLFDASQTAGQGAAVDPPAGSPGVAETPASAYERKGAKALEFARAQIGKPCVWGATGPDSYDCSSLIQAAWRTAGVELPRTAIEQAGSGTPIDLADLQPGDLIFFYSEVNHVGLYAGDGKMVHAPSPGASIREESVFFAGPQAIHSAVRPA